MTKKTIEADKNTDNLSNIKQLTVQEQAFRDACKYFDEEDFVIAQNSLEEVRIQDFTANRIFYDGLIMYTSAFFDFQLNKYESCLDLLERADNKLNRFRPAYQKIDVDALLAVGVDWRAYLENFIEQKQSDEAIPAFPKLNLKLE